MWSFDVSHHQPRSVFLFTSQHTRPCVGELSLMPDPVSLNPMSFKEIHTNQGNREEVTMPGNEAIVSYHSSQTHSRFRLLHVFELLLYNLETMGHALLELSESSDPQLLLDLGKLLFFLVEFLT